MKTIDTLLVNGDHSCDSRGIPMILTGERELIQQALLRLTVKKGCFELDPSLGSGLYKLREARGGDLERLALSYAQEALLPMSEVSVASVKAEHSSSGVLKLYINLVIQQNQYQLEVDVK